MKYTLEVERKEDGTTSMRSTNDGFNPLEILGLLAFKIEDVRKQMTGEVKPDIIKRTVIE
jgi:hypothetical protein